MPPQMSKPALRSGRFIDTKTGLIVPDTYQATPDYSRVTLLEEEGKLVPYNQGVTLDREPETLVVRWPRKGSGLDDLVCEAIVDGYVANVGVAPVIAPQISALLRKQQDQALSATVELVGKETPMKAARNAIARFNDSPMGITDGLKTMVHHLRTFNRGCPIATIPITYDMEQWESLGITPIPIVADGQPESGATKFYLEVDWSRLRYVVPYLPNPFDLTPTGSTEWPYWYRATYQGKARWILLHQTQIIPLIPGKTRMAGIGTSSVWMCLGYLAESILVLDARLERSINALSDGVYLFSGIEDDPATIKNTIKKNREESKDEGYFTAKGTTFITTPNQARVVKITFREDDSVPFEERRQYNEDVLAICFGEPLSAVVIRGGVGYGVQSDEASNNSAETGIGSLLELIGLGLGAIYPRVQVTVSRPNDRAKRLNLGMFKDFTEAVQRLPEDTLTRDELRIMINKDIWDIPDTGDDTLMTTADATEDQSDDGTATSSDDAPPDTDNDEMRALLLAVLTTNEEVTIETEDVDRALTKARTRVGQKLYDILNATVRQKS